MILTVFLPVMNRTEFRFVDNHYGSCHYDQYSFKLESNMKSIYLSAASHKTLLGFSSFVFASNNCDWINQIM